MLPKHTNTLSLELLNLSKGFVYIVMFNKMFDNHLVQKCVHKSGILLGYYAFTMKLAAFPMVHYKTRNRNWNRNFFRNSTSHHTSIADRSMGQA